MGIDKVTASFSAVGNVTVSTGAHRWYAEEALTIESVRVSVGTAPVGSALIVDVNKNGTTIFTTQGNRPQVADGSATGVTTTMDVTSLAQGDYLTVDIDQVGSTTAGADLVVTVVFVRVGGTAPGVATDSIWDAKGDLAAGTGANTAAKLTVGANGTVLVAASGETTGLLWRHAVRPMRSGYRYVHELHYAQSTGIPGEGQAFATPLMMPTVTLDRIGCDVTTVGSAGAVIRLGIYADGGGYPDALILDAGTLDATSTGGTNIREITISQTLNMGLYWLAFVIQGGATTRPTVRRYHNKSAFGEIAQTDNNFNWGKNSYVQSSVTGALPSNWTSTTTDSDTPMISVRVA